MGKGEVYSTFNKVSLVPRLFVGARGEPGNEANKK